MKKKVFFLGAPTNPMTGTVSITNAAFNVYSSLPLTYSFVPSIGSISQNIFDLFFYSNQLFPLR